MSQDIRLIVGLGNPGLDYAKTRHNVGFMTVDRLAARHGATFARGRFGLVAKWGAVLLQKPLTFMNLSGNAVGPLARFYKLSPEEVLVISDDLDLPLGRIRVKSKGSSGGHNGLKSVAQVLGTDNFPRIKIGVSRPPGNMPVIDWVLKRFDRGEWEQLGPILEDACDAAEWVVVKGIEAAMNQFNGK